MNQCITWGYNRKNEPTTADEYMWNATHHLLPYVHCLLILLVVFEQHHVHHGEVGNCVSVSFKVLSDFHSHKGWRNMKTVQLDDVRSLQKNVC